MGLGAVAPLEQGLLLDPHINNGMLEGFICDITEAKELEAEKDRAIRELEGASREIKRLQGILPICSSCKKIRNDEGAWEKMEVYIRERSEVEFSHGICPDCLACLYPESGG